MIGLRAFGRMCRKMIRRSRTPTARAASTNSRSRIDRNRLRTSRADAHPAEQPEDQHDQQTATLAAAEEARLTTRITNSSGRLSMTSTIRIRKLSVKPPMKPAIGADDRADEDADEHAREADEERRPGAVDDERQHVALEAAGLAERVGERRRPRPCADDLVRPRDRRGSRTGSRIGPMIAIDEQGGEDPEADQRQAVLLELAPGELPLAEGLEADLVVDGARSSSGRVSMSSTATSGTTSWSSSRPTCRLPRSSADF